MLSPDEIEDPLITSEQLLSLKSDMKIIELLEEISNKHCPQQFQDIENGGKISKSNEKAIKLRQDGLKFLKQKNYLKSLLAFTESITNAENHSEILGLAYAGRSQILFDCGYYKETLEDIERALSNNYPNELLESLEERKKQAEELIKTKKNYRKKIYHESIPKILNRNKTIHCAADTIEIIKDHQFNNCDVIAMKNIEAGEIISIEKPYAVAVKNGPKEKFLHCHECLEFSYNLIPCRNCRTALYCSEECRINARNSYHYNECDLFQYDFTEQLNLKTVLKCIKEIMETMNNNNNNNNNNQNGIQLDNTIYNSNRYEEIQALKTNKEKRIVRDFFEATNEAYIYNYFLKKYSNFFEIHHTITSERLKELLFHHYFITSCNKITIEKIKKTSINTEYQEVADGIYAFSSLLKHHCYGNITSTFYGSVLVLRAAKNIKKGESCCLTYRNLNFAEYPKLLRSHQLWKYYYYDCNCEACEYNWPIFDCLNIGKTEEYQKFIEVVQKSFDKLSSSDLKNGNYGALAENNNNDLLKFVLKHVKELSSGEPTKVDLNIKRIFCDLLKLSGNKILDF